MHTFFFTKRKTVQFEYSLWYCLYYMCIFSINVTITTQKEFYEIRKWMNWLCFSRTNLIRKMYCLRHGQMNWHFILIIISFKKIRKKVHVNRRLIDIWWCSIFYVIFWFFKNFSLGYVPVVIILSYTMKTF